MAGSEYARGAGGGCKNLDGQEGLAGGRAFD